MTITRFHKGAFTGINMARAMSEPRYAVYDGDFFSKKGITATAGGLGGYVISGDGTQTCVLEALLPGIGLTFGTGATNNNSCLLTRQTAVGAFDITIGSGRELAYETRFKIVQGLYVGMFIGLMEPPTENNFVTDTSGVLGNLDAIGFHVASDSTDVDVDGVTRIKDAAVQTGAETMTEDEDDDFQVYGFRFDGNETIYWFLDNEVVDEQTIASATFPTGQSLLPVFGIKTTAGSALKTVTMDYWQCVQLMRAEDQLAD